MKIDMNEWNRQLENGTITDWPTPINVPKPELTEEGLYELYIKNKNYPINHPVTEYDKQKFVEYDFEFRTIYEKAHRMNFAFDNFSEEAKRIMFPWLYEN